MTFLTTSVTQAQEKKNHRPGMLTKQRQHGTQRASLNLNFIFYNVGEGKKITKLSFSSALPKSPCKSKITNQRPARRRTAT